MRPILFTGFFFSAILLTSLLPISDAQSNTLKKDFEVKNGFSCDLFLNDIHSERINSFVSVSAVNEFKKHLKLCLENTNNLSNLNFNQIVLADIDLSNKQIRGANFKDSTLTNVDFTNSNLDNSNFQSAKLDNVNFAHSSIHHVDFTGAYFNNLKYSAETFEKSILLDAFFDCDSPFPAENIPPDSAFKLFFDSSLTTNPNIVNELSINVIAPGVHYEDYDTVTYGMSADFTGVKVASCIVPPMEYLHSGTNRSELTYYGMPAQVVGWNFNSDPGHCQPPFDDSGETSPETAQCYQDNPAFFYTTGEQRVHLITGSLKTKVFAQLTFKENGNTYTDTEQLSIDSVPNNSKWWHNDNGKKLDLFLLPNHDDFPVTVDLLDCNDCPDDILKGKSPVLVPGEDRYGNPTTHWSWQPDQRVENALTQPATLESYDTFQIFVDDEYEDEGIYDWVVSHVIGWALDEFLKYATAGIYNYGTKVLTAVDVLGPSVTTSLGDFISKKIGDTYDTPFVTAYVYSEKSRQPTLVVLFEVGDGQYASPKIRASSISTFLTDKIYVLYDHKERNVYASIAIKNPSSHPAEPSSLEIDLKVNDDGYGYSNIAAYTAPSTPLLFMYSEDNVTWTSFEEKTTSSEGIAFFKWTDYPENLDTVYVKARDLSSDIIFAESNTVQVNLNLEDTELPKTNSFDKIKIFTKPLELRPPGQPSKFIDEINQMPLEKIRDLSKDKISQFSPEVIKGLKEPVLGKITINQFSFLPVESTKSLTGAKLGQFKEVLPEITPQIAQRLDAKAISTMPPDSIQELPYVTKSIFKTKSVSKLFGSVGQSMGTDLSDSKLFVAPLQQTKIGVLPEHVVCNDGLVLISFTHADKSICVKPSTAEKIQKRSLE